MVPLFPALFANRLFVDRISHSRGSAPLLPILWTQFSSELLSVAHSTVQYFPNFIPRLTRTSVHLFIVTRVPHLYSTVTFAFFFCRCAIPVVIPFKQKTFVAIAWDERVLSHNVRSFVWFTIPLETNSLVHYRQCQIYLKVVTARMVIQISFPLFLSNVTFNKKTHQNIRCVNYPVQRPAENSQVVSICADCRQVVWTILIISVNGIVISEVIRLRLGSNNSMVCSFLSFIALLWTYVVHYEAT
jgi:hypothetical protein